MVHDLESLKHGSRPGPRREDREFVRMSRRPDLEYFDVAHLAENTVKDGVGDNTQGSENHSAKAFRTFDG